MWRKPRGVTWIFVSALLIGTFAWVAVGQNNARKINDSALKDAGKNKEEWISYNRDWSETRFSPLDQINDKNVKTLGLAWSYDIPNVGQGTRHEGTPLRARQDAVEVALVELVERPGRGGGQEDREPEHRDLPAGEIGPWAHHHAGDRAGGDEEAEPHLGGVVE